ncbi:high-affinity choline transport protein (BCCT-family transporter) [Escherichia coli]|uniref:High-affinity choline transport protein (BCCT-family transporter) n=1 Tax=Escherichia coli TaxID=562 RepID=A0A377E2J8_ECOLX|nr:high-affinity choline transport protein (BCCT-family transporter) [Escherichia coli]
MVAVCRLVSGAYLAWAYHSPVRAGHVAYPFTFTLLWLSVFGNSALYEIIHGGAAFAEEAMVHPERGFYSLLAQYPAFTFSASVATITGLLFYVTSADSGALVLGNFTSQLKDINSDAPGWLRVFWSVAIGLLTLGMLMTNGISALQNTTVIMGLPFSFVIFFVMAGLYKSLKVEDYRRESANRDTDRDAGASGSPELEKTSLAPDELSGHALH